MTINMEIKSGSYDFFEAKILEDFRVHLFIYDRKVRSIKIAIGAKGN
jgi:hypothetical protein